MWRRPEPRARRAVGSRPAARRWVALARVAAPVALLLFAVGPSVGSPAFAHPVRIGRYAEIPYGIRPGHLVPTDRGGPRRTGRVPGVAPSSPPTRRWQLDVGRFRRPLGPTVSADGTLYFGTLGGLVAVTGEGALRWSVRLGVVPAPPSIAPSDDIVAVTRGGLIVVVSPEGIVRRSADLGAPARGSALVLPDGSILVTTIDRRVHRYDADLRRVFVSDLPDGTASTLSRTARGRIAVPAGNLLTLLAPDGSILSQVGLGSRASAPVAVADDGTLWVTTAGPPGMLLAIEPSGRVRARVDLGARHFDGAALVIGHDGAVRVPTTSEGLICVGPYGTERWRLPNDQNYQGPASIDDEDTTLVIDRMGRLVAVSADGHERWHVSLGSRSHSAPAIGADGTLYVTTEDQVQGWR